MTFTKMLWPEQRSILRSSKPSVRLSPKDFLFPETQTLTAPPEKPICPFPSPVQKGKERFTWQRGNLLGIVGGIIGLAAGLFLGFALGAALASVFHVSSFEGGAGYFAISIAILVTSVVAPVLIVGTLFWRGIRGIWLFIGLVIVCVSMAAIGASGFGIWYAAQPHVLNLNGPTPLLEFEVKPPAGQSVQGLADVQPELDTDRN